MDTTQKTLYLKNQDFYSGPQYTVADRIAYKLSFKQYVEETNRISVGWRKCRSIQV